MNQAKELGASGEELAAQFLCQRGYRILARNLKSRYGEIDILAVKDGMLVVVEVKTKQSTAFGHPAEMITLAKQRKLRTLALWAASQYNMVNYRIDVIAIRAWVQPVQIEHYPSAV